MHKIIALAIILFIAAKCHSQTPTPPSCVPQQIPSCYAYKGLSTGSPRYYTPVAGKIIWIGTSVTQGVGASDLWHSYVQVASRWLAGYGFVSVNLGIAGSSLATQQANIPVKDNTMYLLNIEFGPNELLAGMDTATFHANYNSFVNAALAKGWTGSQISIQSISGSAVGADGTSAQQVNYNTVMKQVAAAFGAKYTDAYGPFFYPVYNFLTSAPTLHPNDQASNALGQIAAGSIFSTFSPNISAAFADTLQARSIVYRNRYAVPYGQMLGVDSAGNVGIINVLPDKTITSGELIQAGSIMHAGAFVPNGFDTANSILLSSSGAIEQAVNGNTYGFFQPMNTSGNTIVQNTYASGQIQLLAPLVFTQQTVQIGQQGVLEKIQGGATNYIDPSENGTGNWKEANPYPNGNRQTIMSDSTAGTPTTMEIMTPKGLVILQEGGTYTEVRSSRLTVNSTSEGVLPFPRMTAAQMNSIVVGRIQLGTIGTGTGYTNGSYPGLSLTGGSGSGAVASVSVAGGAVNSVLITNKGVGYKRGDVLTATIPGGSGFTYTLSRIYEDGLSVFNLDAESPYFYNATTGAWVAY